MTVETTVRKETFAGGQDSMDFSFRTLASNPEYVNAKKTLISSGEDTDLVYDTDYTVAVNSDGIGGTVTMTPSVSTLYTVTVYRVTENKQESDYEDYNQFPADTIENDFDRRTLIAQESSEESDRTVKASITASTATDLTLPSPSASTVIGWNDAADALQNYANPDTAATLAGLYASTASTQATAAAASAVEASQYASSAGTITVSNSTSAMTFVQNGSGNVINVTAGTNANYGFNLYNLGKKDGIREQQVGQLSAGTYALNIFTSVAQTSSTLVTFNENAGVGVGSTIDVAAINNTGTGKVLYLIQNGVSAANKYALHVLGHVGSNQTNSPLVLFECAGTSSTQPVLELNAAFTVATSEGVLNIINSGSGDSIHDDSHALLSAAGVWTDAPCCHANKEEVQELTIDGFIDKIKSLKLFSYKKVREVRGAKKPVLSTKETKEKDKQQGKEYKEVDGKLYEIVGMEYDGSINANARTYKGYILDDPSTPDELIARDSRTGGITGVSAADGVNFLLGVCKELIGRIEALESAQNP